MISQTGIILKFIYNIKKIKQYNSEIFLLIFKLNKNVSFLALMIL